MIISRTPLRISFVGGGSDFPAYYENFPGAVVSTAINKFIYINVNKKFDNLIRASYSITEFVKKPCQLKHELIKEALLLLGLDGGIEITSISDIPSQGTGLGSSSTYTVGLLNALHAFKNEYASSEKLAREACFIEMIKCRKPIGKQDQYAAAYGNFNFIQFWPDGSVSVEPIICKKQIKKRLEENLLLLYTGLTRKSESILEEQKRKTEDSGRSKEVITIMVGLAKRMKQALEVGELDKFGDFLDENWKLKKQLALKISNPQIDGWYEKARRLGALGGKILGAGGGGFLLLYVPKKRQAGLKKSLKELRPIPFAFEPEGSKIIYYSER